MRFQFVARSGENSIPIEVNVEYKPGKQIQRARRLAAGKLLADLEVEQATIDASGEDRVILTTDAGVWVIGEGGTIPEKRGVV